MTSDEIQDKWIKHRLSPNQSVWDWNGGVALSDGHIWLNPESAYVLIKEDNSKTIVISYSTEQSYQMILSRDSVTYMELTDHVQKEEEIPYFDQPELDPIQGSGTSWGDPPWVRDRLP